MIASATRWSAGSGQIEHSIQGGWLLRMPAVLIRARMQFYCRPSRTAFRMKRVKRTVQVQEWDEWLSHTITSADVSPSDRETALQNWKSAPSALFCHPREEHLLPLFVTAAAAGGAPGRVIWSDLFAGFRNSSFQWD